MAIKYCKDTKTLDFKDCNNLSIQGVKSLNFNNFALNETEYDRFGESLEDLWVYVSNAYLCCPGVIVGRNVIMKEHCSHQFIGVRAECNLLDVLTHIDISHQDELFVSAKA